MLVNGLELNFMVVVWVIAKFRYPKWGIHVTGKKGKLGFRLCFKRYAHFETRALSDNICLHKHIKGEQEIPYFKQVTIFV